MGLSARHRAYLEDKYGDRVNFMRIERKLYSHDIAAVPSMIKPLIGDTTPDGIVQPETEADLSEVVRWAYDNRIPLTPRAKASSGYGGVLPLQGGLVVDFFRMNKVVAIDAQAQTATVQAGIVWEKLDRALDKADLMLRLYPSSYPGSTVGGWFAQGGAGFGSYEAGWFRDNVVKARVVLPTGEIKDFTGDELDMIADAEGTTGLISELTIKVQPKEELEVVAVGCPDAYDLQKIVKQMIERKLPIWSLVFINPKMAELKNRAPLREHHERPAEERVLLPASYITTLAFRKSDRDEVMTTLPQILKPCEGEILDQRIAEHEWKHRFKLMVVKRLGPSLVPAEVVIPLDSFGNVMAEIEGKIQQPIVKEGVVIRESLDGKPEVVILGFIPSDQRKFSYNFVFPLSLTIMKIAEANGGRPYATGLYFKHKADSVLGKDRVRKLKAFKKQVDPRGLANPGKVTGGGVLAWAMAVANIFEPMIRPFGNHVITRVGERPTKPIRGIPADVAWYAYGCSQCGYCVEECDQFYGRGWESQSPRGKWYWLREYLEGREDWSQFMVDTMLVCTTCELCNLRCSASLPIEPSWMKLRGKLIHEDKKMTFPPFEMMAAALTDQGNIWAHYRKDRTEWVPEDLREKIKPGEKKQADVVYFAGCTASYVEHDIAQATVRLLDAAGIDFAYAGKKENCCGTPMLVAGKWEVFADTVRKNIEAVRNVGGKTVVTSCPACNMMWRHVYPEWAEKLGIDYDFTAKHYSEVLTEKIRSGDLVFPENGRESERVAWHDSCHMGRVSQIYEEPRELIKAVPGAELVELPFNRDNAHCCGSVLTLIKDPPVAAEVGGDRMNEAAEVGAQKLLAACPCCEVQLRISAEKKNVPVEVVDLAHYAAAALGYEFPDPNPEVQKQWGVFDAFISLMTPRGFANLMSKMFPELIDAMPYGMGPMMRLMGKIPGALTLMKPMFPVLFPIFLPKMMPKVMDTMLKRVSEQIEMPDYMREQMPGMMPKVMDNLMPHMLPDVVPLVTPMMIDYLHGKTASR